MLDRTVAPPYIQGTSFELISPGLKKLSNGIDLLLIPGGSQEVLKIELIFPSGRWFETEWGASYFTAHLLSKGTKLKNSFEIAQIFDQYGAHVEVSPGLDYISISLYCLTSNLAPILSLFQEILREPSFPEKEFEQTTSIFLQNLKINMEKTSYLASKFFRKNLFGEDHPYGKEIEEADVKALNRDHLENYFRRYLKTFTVFVSGKISDKTEKLVTSVFESWDTLPAETKEITANTAPTSFEHIEREDSVQSSIRLGALAIGRNHPDYFHGIFTSHILGGYFGSRLMKNIREEKGLTYGIYASLHPLKHASYISIGADVNKENINITFEEIRKEIHRLRTEPISTDELDTARNHFIGSLQSEITTPFAHADKIKTLYLFGLPANYYQQMISTIKNTTADDILSTSEKYFNDEKYLSLAVG